MSSGSLLIVSLYDELLLSALVFVKNEAKNFDF